MIKILWRHYQCWRWKSRLDLDRHLRTLQRLSANINGFQLSRNARTTADAFEYVYGEIDSTSFLALLSLIKPNPTTIFYDLGSGTGKAVLACAMVFDVQKAYGIELFASLHDAAKQQAQALKALPDYQDKARKIEFICGDFLNIDFSNATLIFISATALFGDTWIQLNHRLEQLSQAPVIITTSKKLLSPQFQVLHQTKVQMSWGVVTAYIHKIS